MSIKDQMASAKAYIQDGQYDKARKILKGVKHPTAEKWLAQLNEKYPPPPLYRKRWFRVVAIIGIILVLAGLFLKVVLEPRVEAIFEKTALTLMCEAGETACEQWIASLEGSMGALIKDCVYFDETLSSMYFAYEATLRRCLIENGYATEEMLYR